MKTQVTLSELKYLVERINTVTGSPSKPWDQADGRSVANVGNYHLSGAYGGYCLHRMANEGGGVTTPLLSYHAPKRELALAMRAFLSGLEFKSA